MVFRTIEGDLTKSGQSISVFRKEIQTLIRDVSNARGLNNKINAVFSKGLTDYDVKQLKEYNKLINQGQNCQSAYYRTLQHTSTAAQELAMSANGAAVSEKTLETSTKSLSITQRIAATSSKVLAGAISLIGNISIALAINAIISLISNLVKREGELAENAKEASSRYKEQAEGLGELKKKYQEICDSEETEAEKIANLNELKKELINNYGLTEDALKNLNTEREEGIKLLDEEISKMNRRDRNLLLNENREAYNKAIKKIENVNPNVAQDTVSTLNVNNISDNIKKMFSKIGEDDLFNWSGQVETYFEIDADNIIDQYDKIGDVISALTDKKNTYNGITDDEAHLLYLLNNTYKKLGKTIETHGDNYKDYYSYYAQNKFEDFESSYDFEAEGANDYNTYRKALLDSAGDDKRLKSEFEKILSDKFSNEDSNLTSQTEVTILPSVSADTSKLKSNLDSLKEQINDIFKNTDLFDKAIESLNKGEAIDFDSVMSMVEVDGSLAGKFIQTADGYTIAVDKLIEARQKYTEETRASIQADIESSKQTIKVAEQNIAEMQKTSDSIAYAATQDKGAYQRKKELDEAIQSEKGHIEELNNIIAEDTLILGEMENGVSSAKSSIEELSATLDTASKKQSLLKSAMEDMSETGYISASTYAELVELGGNFAECLEVQNGKLVLNIEKLKELESAEYDTAIAAKELEIAKWKAINGASLKGDFSNQAELEEMEREKAFLERLRDEWNSTKPDGKKSSGSSGSDDKPQSVLDFEEELSRRQHEIKMGRMEEDEDYFDWLEKAYKEAYAGVEDCQDDLYKYEEMVYEGRKKLAEDFYNEQKKYHENRIDELEDTLSKVKDGKITSLVTQEDIDNLKQFNKEMQKTYGLGNVDLTKRPKVDSKAMRKAGYDVDDGETATVFSSTEFVWQGDDKNGKYVAVHYTPILPDGTVLDQDTLSKYIYDTLESSEDILKTDAKNLGIVLKVDTDLDISDDDIRSLETNNPTKHIQDVIKACDDWDISLHEVQEQWMNLTESIQSDSKDFTPAEKFDYIRAIYNDLITETQKRIDEIVQIGIEGHEDEVKELEKQIEDYRDKLQDTFKDEIDYEIDYIERLQDKYNDFIDERIKQYEKEKDAVKDRYDSEIKSIDKTIDALKDKNNETKTAIDLKKAEQDLEKSRQRTRMTYGSDGTIVYKQDDEAIAEAQQKVDDLKLDMIVSNLEKQKEALEEQKATEVDKFDTMITALNEQKEKQSDYYDSLIDILNAYLNPNATESIDSVWERVLANKDKVQTNEEFTTVNGEIIDTSKVDKGEVKADKVNDKLNNDGKTIEELTKNNVSFGDSVTKFSDATDMLLDMIYKNCGNSPDSYERYKKGEFNDTLGVVGNAYKYNNIAQNNLVSDLLKSAKNVTSTNNNQSITFNIGDIIIQNPVGDTKKLAQEIKNQLFKEAMMQIPNDAMKIIHSNLR